MRIPKHIGIIPDGNRRWAIDAGLRKKDGYEKGLEPGVRLLNLAKENNIEEITYYGFTADNCKRPKEQVEAFRKACVEAVNLIAKNDVSLLVVGNYNSKMFPKELLKYRKRVDIGKGGIKVNFLVNYSWEWDLENVFASEKRNLWSSLKTVDISRVDLIVRWGGRRRLSGFLPIQSVYSDFYVLDNLWPDFKEKDFYDALSWYQKQDITLGG